MNDENVTTVRWSRNGPFIVVAMRTFRGSIEYDWALVGPDETVWHVSAFAKQLQDRGFREAEHKPAW